MLYAKRGGKYVIVEEENQAFYTNSGYDIVEIENDKETVVKSATNKKYSSEDLRRETNERDAQITELKKENEALSAEIDELKKENAALSKETLKEEEQKPPSKTQKTSK